MARGQCIGVREVLTSLVPDATLQCLAREIGGLRRSYEQATGESLVPSALYDRFTAATTRFVRTVLAVVLGRLGKIGRPLSGALGALREVLAADARLVKLHQLLARRYPGSRTHSSSVAAKRHVVLSVTGAGAKSVKVTHGRACDHRVLRVGPESVTGS